MDATIIDLICRATGSRSCELGQQIQPLWSGYGMVQKATLMDDPPIDVVVKWVDLSEVRSNRVGWTGTTSHQRKVKSYQVEQQFYQQYSRRCGTLARVPKLLGAMAIEDSLGWVMVLEDLDAAGFSIRKTNIDLIDVGHCLDWIAHFHATFLNVSCDGLWEQGTYWHLATRPDELEAMQDGPLKQSAAAIDRILSDCKFQTLLHGDAKLANFCFADSETRPRITRRPPSKPLSVNAYPPTAPSPNHGLNHADRIDKVPSRVAAVDFQYVGRGCGMKDVAYFLTSCLTDQQCQQHWSSLLDRYFDSLHRALGDTFEQGDALENQWRQMFPLAWADFNRFLHGWSPGHWKLTSFSKQMTDDAIAMARQT